jgi:hypothetical protein
MIRWTRTVKVLAALSLAACASGQQRPANEAFASESAPLAFELDGSSAIDLPALIDPEGRAAALPGCEPRPPGRGQEAQAAEAARRFECALRAFKTYHRTAGLDFTPEADARAGARSVALALRRNEVQDRIVLRSDALCDDFQRRLDIELRVRNETDFGNWLRISQTQMLGGAGALLLDSSGLWALTAVSRLTGVPRETVDEGQIEKAAVRIARQGMDQRRAALFEAMRLRRARQPRFGGLAVDDRRKKGVTSLSEYGLERAIADAIGYHQACTISEGLAYVEEVMTTNRPVPVAVEFPALETDGRHGAGEGRSVRP